MYKKLIICFFLSCINQLNQAANKITWLNKIRKDFLASREERNIVVDNAIGSSDKVYYYGPATDKNHSLFELALTEESSCYICASKFEIEIMTEKCKSCSDLFYCLKCKPEHLSTYHPFYWEDFEKSSKK